MSRPMYVFRGGEKMTDRCRTLSDGCEMKKTACRDVLLGFSDKNRSV